MAWSKTLNPPSFLGLKPRQITAIFNKLNVEFPQQSSENDSQLGPCQILAQTTPGPMGKRMEELVHSGAIQPSLRQELVCIFKVSFRTIAGEVIDSNCVSSWDKSAVDGIASSAPSGTRRGNVIATGGYSRITS